MTSTRTADFAKLRWTYESQVMHLLALASNALTERAQAIQDIPTQNVAGRYDVQGSPFHLETQEPLEYVGNRQT